MGRVKQKERERKRAAASCQRLDKLFSSKRNKTVESESEILRQSDNDTCINFTIILIHSHMLAKLYSY